MLFLLLANGYSFNYITLLAHFYAASPFKTAAERITHAMFEIGPLIIASFTTLLPTSLLLLAFESGTMFRLGIVLTITCVGNFTIAFLFFPSLLNIVGPYGTQGQVPWFSLAYLFENSTTLQAIQTELSGCSSRIGNCFKRFDPIFREHNYPIGFEAIMRGNEDADGTETRTDSNEKPKK